MFFYEKLGKFIKSSYGNPSRFPGWFLLGCYLFVGLVPKPAQAQCPISCVAKVNKTGTVTTTFVSVTCSGVQRLLLLKATIQSAAVSITKATYAGVALTPYLRSADSTNATSEETWYMVNPPTGANPVSITLSASAYMHSSNLCFQNVNQTTPFGASGAVTAQASSAAHAITLTTTAANSWIVDQCLVADATKIAITVPAPQVVLVSQTGNKETRTDELSTTSIGTYTLNYTFASAHIADMQAVELIPSGCTPTPTSTVTGTFTPTSTGTWTPTITNTPSITFTPTMTPTSTITSSPTVTSTQTQTTTGTQPPTWTPTNTNTITVTPTITISFTSTITLTSTNSITLTPTLTPTVTLSPTVTTTYTSTPPLPWTCNGTWQSNSVDPNGIAEDTANGYVYVADQTNAGIDVFNASSGVSIASWSGTPAKYALNTPFGVAVDGSGHVFVTDTGTNEVYEFDGYGANTGKGVNVWGGPTTF